MWRSSYIRQFGPTASHAMRGCTISNLVPQILIPSQEVESIYIGIGIGIVFQLKKKKKKREYIYIYIYIYILIGTRRWEK